jgi:hypothetical protein
MMNLKQESVFRSRPDSDEQVFQTSPKERTVCLGIQCIASHLASRIPITYTQATTTRQSCKEYTHLIGRKCYRQQNVVPNSISAVRWFSPFSGSIFKLKKEKARKRRRAVPCTIIECIWSNPSHDPNASQLHAIGTERIFRIIHGSETVGHISPCGSQACPWARTNLQQGSSL